MDCIMSITTHANKIIQSITRGRNPRIGVEERQIFGARQYRQISYPSIPRSQPRSLQIALVLASFPNKALLVENLSIHLTCQTSSPKNAPVGQDNMLVASKSRAGKVRHGPRLNLQNRIFKSETIRYGQ